MADVVRILAGDVGGTNARFMLYEVDRANLSCETGSLDPSLDRTLSFKVYKNDKFSTFTQILSQFMQEVDSPEIAAACFAVAGPVQNNRINFTNRNWILDAEELRVSFNLGRVRLINDFVSNGYGLLGLKPENLVVLQEGRRVAGAPIACVGAGTGLGECYLTPGCQGGLYDAFASEGGHVEFPPKDALEDDLLAFLRRKFGSVEAARGFKEGMPARISVERVVSGNGLVNIYEFMKERFPEDVVHEKDEGILAAADRGAAIAMAAYDYPLCKQALMMMLSIYGSEVGNVALKFLPYGGLYIAGGIAPKNIEYIRQPDSDFMKALRNKGRLSSAVADIPIAVVMKEELGVLGAHLAALRLARELISPPGASTATRDAAAGATEGSPASGPQEAGAGSTSSSRSPGFFSRLRVSQKVESLYESYPLALTLASQAVVAATVSSLMVSSALSRR